jgi:hypothetical protein
MRYFQTDGQGCVDFMKRILFWTMVAMGLCAFFFGLLQGKRMSLEGETVFFASVIFVVFATLTWITAWMLIDTWKRGVAEIMDHQGGIRVWSRDSQPFTYWSIMSGIFLIFTLFAFGTCLSASEWRLLPVVLKQMMNH